MRRLITAFTLTFLCLGVAAQTTGELLRLTQYNFGISTARSAAMGGAFTSLGADISSMSINPAGLGMYTKGEISFTPQLRLNSSMNGYVMGNPQFDIAEEQFTKNKVMIGSFGIVYPVGDLTLGFGYNRLANFHSRSSFSGIDQPISIADMFARQLKGINSESIKPSKNGDEFFIIPPTLWSAMMAYHTFGVDNISNTSYFPVIGEDAWVYPHMIRDVKGAVDEYALSAAYNVGQFNFGFTLGIQSFRYKKDDTYSETTDMSTVKPNEDSFEYIFHRRVLELSGTGVNMKFGAIYRPLDWLRVGVSYHTPTWIRIEEEYFEDMGVYFDPDGNDPYFGSYYQESPIYLNRYSARSSSRLLTGISFTIAKRAIISIDYKRAWPDKMKYKRNFGEYDYRAEITTDDVDYYDELYDESAFNPAGVNLNHIIKREYRATNNYSIGVEGNFGKGFFARGGYMYQTSPYSYGELSKYGRLNQWSIGAGYRDNSVSIDLAYTNNKTKNLPYAYYDYAGIYPDGAVTSRDRTQHIILSIGIRL